MKSLIATLTLSIGLAATTMAQAALVDRGGGLIYDTDLNITWLQNANANGLMTWSQANTWASNLSYYDSVRDVTYDDWRLPAALNQDGTGPCEVYNCTGSEMGHLFYNELGGVAGTDIATTHNANYYLFQNVQSYYYWLDMEYALDASLAWDFDFYYGRQVTDSKDYNNYAWAVRAGDVAAVPVPAAVWLFGSGLLGLIGVARHKKS